MRIGIVYSQTSAQHAYSQDIYIKLFMAAQTQATIAGIPYDILTEADLTDINKVKQYDTLLFPNFVAAGSDKIAAITSTLSLASSGYNVGMVAQGEFLITDEKAQSFTYDRMRAVLGLERAGGANEAQYQVVAEAGHAATMGYADGEPLGNYHLAYSYYRSISGPATSLADIVIGDQRFAGVIATETGGRNVHFATDGMMGDSNLLSNALRWSVFGNEPSVTLQTSRQASLVAVRVDMDRSAWTESVSPVDADGNPLPGIYDKMNPIIEQWKKDYNFVGSFYINVGENPPSFTTDWVKSSPYYRTLLDLGNEIGTHSENHPSVTDLLTSDQIRHEFLDSKTTIENMLGIKLTGAAVPGDPEGLETSRLIGQYFEYMSGGTVGLGAGYLNAVGYLTPSDQSFMYIAPNVASDYSQVGFYHKSIAETEAFWQQQWTDITSHASIPIVVWGIHDYGIAESDTRGFEFETEMFTNFIKRAHDANAEFVTLDDVAKRVAALQHTQVNIEGSGDLIRATLAPGASSELGTFALTVGGSDKVIKSVQNWFAYDENSVFVAKGVNEYVINLGIGQDDVTHITRLPSRADLLSVSGDGSALRFTVDGDGGVGIQLREITTRQLAVVGTDDAVLSGDQLGLNLHGTGQHAVSVADGGVLPSFTLGKIFYLDLQDQTYANLYQKADNTSFLQFFDVEGTATWSNYTSYFDAAKNQVAQTVNQKDGTGWTQFWDATGSAQWGSFASYSGDDGKMYAQLVQQRDGTGWTHFWDTHNQGDWAEFATYTEQHGGKYADYILKDNGDVVRSFWDTHNEGDWSQYSSFEDRQGRKYEEYILKDNGDVARSYWDVSGGEEWAAYTQITDPTGKVISHYGTNDDGTNWVIV